MTNKSEKSTLWDAYIKWGYPAQRLVWIEEMAELTTEMAERTKELADFTIEMANLMKALAKSGRLVNGSTPNQIAEEIADVDICLEQMKLVYPNWNKHRTAKMERLATLLKEDE